MKGIELMAVSSPCTTVPDMEMSLSQVGRKSEQDPAASSVGGQPPHCSVSGKYVDAPAVPKLTFIPPAVCSHTSSWLGVTSCLCHSRRGRNVEHPEKKTLVCAHSGIWVPTAEAQMTILPKGTSQLYSAKGNWGSAFILLWLLEKKAKPLTSLTVSYLRKLDNVRCIGVAFPS